MAVGSLIFLDIIASASKRSVPFINIDHRRMLHDFGINLESLFGCSNQIALLILDIICLDSWKRESEKSRRLSLVELVKRGATIEEHLRSHIDNVEVGISRTSDATKTVRIDTFTPQTEATRIFALAAQTYLHVVISGAHWELREIRDSVTKTIDAFKSISDPKSLRNLVWPFCITGCLATTAQQPFFRELISAAGITSSTLGTCWQAFKAMEECWEFRESTSYNCDWAFVFNKQNCHVLLA